MNFACLVALLSLAPSVLGSPASRDSPLRELTRANGPSRDKFIVKLKDGANKADVMGVMSSSIAYEWSIINGFAVDANEETLSTLLSHPDVERVEEDGMVYADKLVTQPDAYWGMGRLSSTTQLQGKLSDPYNYTYDDSAGEGVDIYVIDGGIYIQHPDFGGRASWGATFGDYYDYDGSGHGTHCAGTAASNTWGVAKKANLYAVRVLSDIGEGYWSDLISGMDWVAKQAALTGRPSVATMSLGGDIMEIGDDAAEALVASGVHTTVAAGNEDMDAETHSPARAPSVITVGASDITDNRTYYSNYGAGVDIFAPGHFIRSTWKGSANTTRILSGTSMSTPHVGGLIAYYIALEGNVSPAEMATKLKSRALKGVLADIPSGTDNYLAHNAI